MSYKKEPIIKKISDNLAFSSKSTALKNVIGLFDSNRIAQDFFAELFSLVFGYENLKELDKLNDIVNYPAIDLGDEEAGVAFQITTQKSSEKVKDTIKKFLKHKLNEKYSRLIIFIIGEKQKSYIDFDTENKFVFDKDADIWDDYTLMKDIDKLDFEKLKLIQGFLEENLQDFKYPETLFPADIKNCIEILKRDFGSVEMLKSVLKRSGNDFIEKKNEINNLSWDFFKENIRGHLQYNKDIYDFLSDPINGELQNDYLGVSKAIQEYYKEPSSNCSSFEEVFRHVFIKLNTYDDSVAGLNTKLKILLHNMYFNCDIGDNPKDA